MSCLLADRPASYAGRPASIKRSLRGADNKGMEPHDTARHGGRWRPRPADKSHLPSRSFGREDARIDRDGSEHEALLRVAAAAAGSHDLDEVLELAAEEARRALGATSLAVSRWERERNVLRTLINVGALGPAEERYPGDETYSVSDYPQLERMLLRGQPYFNAVDDPNADPMAVKLLRSLGKHSDVAVPIVVEGVSWGEVWATTGPGEPRFTSADVRFLEAIAGQLAVAIGRAELFSHVSRMAYEDALTGLANRRAVEERLERAVARAREGRLQLCLLLCDVDNLKKINDERGHDAGDRALQLVADALVASSAEHPGSLVGRLSGDELCVVVEGGGLDAGRRIGAAALQALASDRDTPISISCGVAALGAGTRAPAQLLRAADAAQYEAKRRGGGQLRTAEAGLAGSTATSERRSFRGSVDERLQTGVEQMAFKFDGELAGASSLDRLEAMAVMLSEAVNAVAWTISYSKAGEDVIRSLSNASTRDARPRGLRVSLEHEVYPLADYPSSARLVEAGSGSFVVHREDASADPSERGLLGELGYDAVMAAASGDGRGTYLIEIYADGQSDPLSEADLALRLLARAAIPPPPHGADARLRLMLTLGPRLAGAQHEGEIVESATEEVQRGLQAGFCSILRADGGELPTATARRCRGWDVPIRVAGSEWGVLRLEDRDADALGEDDVRVLEAIADQIGAALLRVQLQRELDSARARAR